MKKEYILSEEEKAMKRQKVEENRSSKKAVLPLASGTPVESPPDVMYVHRFRIYLVLVLTALCDFNILFGFCNFVVNLF